MLPLLLALHLLLAGCSSSSVPGGFQHAALGGVLHGGQQPLTNAHVQLYAVSSSGDGAASTPLGASAVTDSAGRFMLGTYTCPPSNPLVYLVASGGNPGLLPGTNNAAASLMADVGTCTDSLQISYVSMNELTTVASVWPIHGLMSSYASVGAAPASQELLVNGFTVANQMVDMATGTSPGSGLPSGASFSLPMLNTLADLIASCINSAGGTAGDGSICGNLLLDATGSTGKSPTNVVDALLNLANRPSSNVSALFGLLSSTAPYEPALTVPPVAWSLPLTWPAPVTASHFTLAGLISPAVVAESIFVQAGSFPYGTSVTYLVDDQMRSTESAAPYWMGGVSLGQPFGFSTDVLSPGAHTLRAVAMLPDNTLVASAPVTLQVVPSLNATLSTALPPYANQLSAQGNSMSTILGYVTTPGATLSANEQITRQQVLAMYMNWGIDPSLDYTNDESATLTDLAPAQWAAPGLSGTTTPLSLQFSRDAPFYQAIPSAWPRTALPTGYIQQLQLNTAIAGDGIGYGEVTAAPGDPSLPIRSEWYTMASTLQIFDYPMSSGWSAALPWQTAGDRHMIFVDPASKTFVSTYKTSVDTNSGGPDALYGSTPTAFNSLGDFGGSTASKFAELPVLLQPGEATNASQPIPHALGGPVGRTWAARVFPASARDANVLTSTNSCTGVGYTNTGLVPYGGVIQLDPTIDLTKIALSLPALRILQAIQTYGYYVMDFGCADLDIYTAISEAELTPFGGLWGNSNGPGVQNEVQAVLKANTLYVVAPLTKKQ